MVDSFEKSTRCDCCTGNGVDIASIILNCERLRSAYDRMGYGGEPFAHSCAEAGSLLMFEYAVAREVSFVVEADDYGYVTAEAVVAVCFYGDSNRFASKGSLIERQAI